MGQRQAGADADFENPLPRPIIGDAHRLLASRMEDRSEDDVVRAGEQAVSPDGIVQIHRLALRCHRRDRPVRHATSETGGPEIAANLAVASQGHEVTLIFYRFSTTASVSPHA